MTLGLSWWHGAYRTGGTLPVAEHLRPCPRGTMTWCPIYERLVVAVDREHWRRYDVRDYMAIPEAMALPVAGEA